ncbi:hypothetical protein BCIN_02g01150 [Botrytis cinerea B05.10]|uniref:Peptidase C14 caspase domain-containing protein n=2 Tax=Botryotinia fuckeliana TaxID=40559 RepID=A0A384J7Y6_BOTFB|nr:hypothetical protein BCIN_02g01150 [Botrytis cinerea B05.10]ATZ46745.1 hypothetical protein BCIN_02g01150 [Botrytis cinerea B05.10]EMR84824.1 putative homeobox domain containing protein [Botrytis cinerea BcDW1]
MASSKSNSILKPDHDIKRVATSTIVIPDYQDKEASNDSKFKAIFDEHMSAKNASVAYREVHVLLLSWDRKDDDLHVEQEVADLESVFRDTFKYKTTQKILQQNPRKHPQAQINLYLAEFVHNYDDPNTLLIVYYAGHGKLSDDGDGLALTPSTTQPDEENELNEIVWSSAEHNIQNTKSDFLVIFDCCNAGAMDRSVRGGDFTRRAFEYMAATSQNSTTRKPGPKSFTAALIWALEELVRSKPGKRFSTQELTRKIFQAPNFPKTQAPRLMEPGPKGSLRKIVLVPLDQQVKFGDRGEHSSGQIDDIKETLNLRFVFNRKITNKIVRELAKDLTNLISGGDFVASTVLWDGINTSNSTKKRFRDVVSHVIGQNHQKNRSKSSILDMDGVQFSPTTPTTPTIGQELSASSEDSTNDEPNPELSLPSPSSEIAINGGETSVRDEDSDTSKKRKREEKTIHDLEAVDTISNSSLTTRQARQTKRHSGDRRL